MWAHLTFHQIEILKSSQVHSWALGNSTTPSSISYYQKIHDTKSHKKPVKTWLCDFWKGSKDFLAMSKPCKLSGSSLLKEEHEVSVLPYSPSVGLSLALQISKLHGFECDHFIFFKFNNLLMVQFHVHVTHSSTLRIIEMKFQTSSNWQLWYWVLQQVFKFKFVKILNFTRN